MPLSPSKRRPLTSYLLLVCIFLFITIYVLTPEPPDPKPFRTTAEERLKLWAAFITPSSGDHLIPPQVDAPDTLALPLNLFPLGLDVATSHPADLEAWNTLRDLTASLPKANNQAFLPLSQPENNNDLLSAGFSSESKDPFSKLNLDLLPDNTEALFDLPQPATNLSDYSSYIPHNYDPITPGSTQKAYATYLFTQNPSLSDAHFASTLQLTYRLLWDPASRSKRHPFIIFISPTVSAQQRSILSGAGALVREIPLLHWRPNTALSHHAYAQISKLHMWNATEFGLLAHLSSNAHPLSNPDGIFASAEEPTPQRCVPSELSYRDAQTEAEMCSYTFAVGKLPPKTPHNRDGDSDSEPEAEVETDKIDPAVMVLSPNQAMHARLLRAAGRPDKFDNEPPPDAGLLMWQFAGDGAFPGRFLERKFDSSGRAGKDDVAILREDELWRSNDARPEWMRGMFAGKWVEMVGFFDGGEFKRARKKDGIWDEGAGV